MNDITSRRSSAKSHMKTKHATKSKQLQPNNMAPNTVNVTEHVPKPFCFTFQEHDTDRLPDDAHSIWKQARDAAVEGMKNKKNGRFYRKAHKKGHCDDWTLGIDQAPPYALRLPPPAGQQNRDHQAENGYGNHVGHG